MRLAHVEGAVLVGGASSRMGREKASLEWDGVPMAQRVAASLRTCIARVRAVVRPGMAPPPGLEAVEDRYPARAALVGVHAALAACEAPAVLVAACDLPEIEPRVLLLLLGLVPAAGGADIVAAAGPNGPEPLLTIYRPRLLPEIERRIESEQLSLRGLLAASDTLLVSEEDLRRADPELRSFRNVNLPRELAPA
ncbi:MAG: molybdenum cofactor guanylyltransferase [Myxococcales bacterium]|nr:molybdenum cofactor guanylyltransferase [Myxococcales bacterium]